jgi:hypothetical protein
MKYTHLRILQFTYALLALMVWPYLSAYVNNPDTFQYINIAREYSSLNFHAAVNGYWSPMVSWLLILFPLKGLQAVVSFKLLQLIVGFFALTVWCRILDRAVPDRFSKRILQWMALPFLLSYAFLYLTADLLFFTVLLVLLNHFIEAPVWNSRKRSLQAALLAVLLYFSKAFGWPLALTLVVVSLVHHRMTSTRIISSHIVYGLLVFFTLSGIWMFLISTKYGHFTISEAAALNTTREVAPLPGQTVRLPVVYAEGLLPPASPTALSAWEEPMQSVRLTQTHPFVVKEDASHLVEVIRRNILAIWYFDFRRQVGMLFLITLIVMILFRRNAIHWNTPTIFYALSTTVSVYAGYALILFHARYSWMCTWLMVLTISCLLVPFIQKASPYLRSLLRGLLMFVALLAVKRPVKEILFSDDRERTSYELLSAFSAPFKTMEQTYAEDKLLYANADSLSRLDGPMASRYSDELNRPRYFSSLLIAQSCGQPYYGQLNDRVNHALMTLKQVNIRYFLVFDGEADSCFGKPPVYALNGIKVFSVGSSAKP